MIRLIDEQKPEIRELIYDIPALFTLYALNHNGHITEKEERNAKRILHVETYTGLSELKAYFNEVEVNYIAKLHHYDTIFSEDNEIRHKEIKQTLQTVIPFFENLDRKKLDNFANGINTFVNNIVKSNKSVMSDFALPIFSQYLDSVNKIFFREVVGLPPKIQK